MEDFLRGQDFADRLINEGAAKIARRSGAEDQRQVSPRPGLGDRYWEERYGSAQGSETTTYVPLTGSKPPLGPISSDNGRTQFYVPTDWESEDVGAVKLPEAGALIGDLRNKPGAMGDFDQVTRFMHQEMKRNFHGRDAVIVSEDNEKPFRKPLAWGRWGYLVWPGHDWDHKSMLRAGENGDREGARAFTGRNSRWFSDGDDHYSYEVWSNIHYGYLGRRAGFSTKQLLHGAGGAQFPTLYGGAVPQEERDRAWGRAKDEKMGLRGFDDPKDQSAVALGIHLYEKYNDRLTLEQFREEVRSWTGLDAVKSPAGTLRPGPIRDDNQ